MRFVWEIVLNRSRDEVWRAFDNPENLKRWEPTLLSFEPVSGNPGQVGAVSRLTYLEGKRSIVLTETITLRHEPDEFAGSYDSVMAVNTISNSFTTEGSGATRWTVSAEFCCRGLWRLLAPLMRGSIRKRLNADLTRFKTELEAGRLV